MPEAAEPDFWGWIRQHPATEPNPDEVSRALRVIHAELGTLISNDRATLNRRVPIPGTVPQDAGLWFGMIATLTLDRTEFYLPKLNFPLSDAAGFKRVGRVWVYAGLTEPKRPSVALLLAWLAEALFLTADDVTRFTHWANNAFRADRMPCLFAWWLSLPGWSRDDSEWTKLGLPPSQSQLLRLGMLDLDKQYETLADAAWDVELQPLSEWDLGIFAALVFEDGPRELSLYLNEAVSALAFIRWWRTLERSLTETELATFLANGNALFAERGSKHTLAPLPKAVGPEW